MNTITQHQQPQAKDTKMNAETQKKIDQQKAILRSGGKVRLQEPCDCGDHIRHNNGGNYHQVITLKYGYGKLHAKFGSTCELLPEPEWEPAEDFDIAQYAHWL